MNIHTLKFHIVTMSPNPYYINRKDFKQDGLYRLSDLIKGSRANLLSMIHSE